VEHLLNRCHPNIQIQTPAQDDMIDVGVRERSANIIHTRAGKQLKTGHVELLAKLFHEIRS
jgi:hypothetical protein